MSDMPNQTPPPGRAVNPDSIAAASLGLRRPPVTTTAGTPVRQALACLRAEHVAAMVVMDGERVAGVVEDRDFIEHALAPDGTSVDATLTVGDVMTRLPGCAAESTTIASALALMDRYGVAVLPVVRDGALAGTLSESDLLRALRNHLAEAHAPRAQAEASSGRAEEPLDAAPDAATRSQVFMSNPLIQNAMELLAQAGI
jgi:CBS domain-containing protein